MTVPALTRVRPMFEVLKLVFSVGLFIVGSNRFGKVMLMSMVGVK